jgi:ParB/RepB/Spo0J family partition protein
MRKLDKKPLNWFKISPQVRRSFDDAADRQLGESLKERQIQPVGARPDGTMLWGGRRWHGATLVGLEFLEVVVTDEALSESEITILQLLENLQRQDISPWDQYVAVRSLQEANPTWMAKDIADRLHKDPSWVTKVLATDKCIAAVKNALKAALIGSSDVYAISKAETDIEQQALLNAKLSGASRDAIERQRRKAQSTNASEVRMAKVKLPLPSGICVTVSGQEFGLDAMSEAFSELQKALRKAISDGWDIKTFSAVLHDRAANG